MINKMKQVKVMEWIKNFLSFEAYFCYLQKMLTTSPNIYHLLLYFIPIIEDKSYLNFRAVI
jgi:hypothetical protein